MYMNLYVSTKYLQILFCSTAMLCVSFMQVLFPHFKGEGGWS